MEEISIRLTLCPEFTDSIEANIETASSHVESANRQLAKASQHQVSKIRAVGGCDISGEQAPAYNT